MTQPSTYDVKFIPSGRGKARCAPDPDYPNGKAIDPGFKVSCFVALPYPAPECGYFLVRCNKCRASVAVTAAGRPDDPISVMVPCEKGKRLDDRVPWEDPELHSDVKHTFHVPTTYPNGGPLYWRTEASGILAEAVHAYLNPESTLTPPQLQLLKEYIAHWINAPCWHWLDDGPSRLECVVMLDQAQDREGLKAVLWELLDAGIDPL